MKIAIIGDIHANLEALEAVLIAIEQEGVSQIVCLGDIVGYGPDPLGCIYRLKEVDARIILGNHDQAVLNPQLIHSFNNLARPSLLQAYEEVLNADERAFLDQAVLHVEENGAIFSHANPVAPEEWEPLFMHDKITWCMNQLKHTVAFVGHTHYAGIYCKMKSRIVLLTSSTAAIGSHQYLINPGSIGQPRDGDWRASYVIWDIERRYVELRRSEYAVQHTQRKILDMGYPEFTAERLSKGE